MITYRELRTPSNVITTVRGVPGRVFEQGGNAQFDTIRDFNSLEPRKIPENPFKFKLQEYGGRPIKNRIIRVDQLHLQLELHKD
ncbi:unnamed protein product [Ambrosiozyma monospora]|uniref:Unnamed protein product n=1 Tax=Ambrosiozyma monospora TaxID=43982 RepID=A0ACB5UE59_AMBMO|nr:unnamed protein product [Ambrosiozyma monospora]